jgi:tetratricopeptide (TPR) repeat protein
MFYCIDKKTLEEKIVNKSAYNCQLKLSKSNYFTLINLEDKLLKLSFIADLYKIGKKYKIAQILFKLIYNRKEFIKNENLLDLINLRYAIFLYSINDFNQSTRLIELLLTKENSTLYHYILQHKGKLEFRKKNYNIALSYFLKAKKLRKNNNELLNSTKLAIKRTTKLL